MHPDPSRRLRRPTLQQPEPGARVLVLLAHPALHRSRVNRALADAVRGLPGVTLHDLYEAYPEHDIDIEHEKRLLLAHDVVVWLHPFYWYSTPSILKEWQDLVLEFGWAYGPGGIALRGKTFLQAITTGGRETAYARDGSNRFTIRELLTPVEQTAWLCGMRFVAPFVVHGTHALGPQEIAGHAADFRRVVAALHAGTVDIAASASLVRINTLGDGA